jgi:hypothetical protein
MYNFIVCSMDRFQELEISVAHFVTKLVNMLVRFNASLYYQICNNKTPYRLWLVLTRPNSILIFN